MNIFILGAQDNNKISCFEHTLKYIPYDVFFSSLTTDCDADLFIWRYSFPWEGNKYFDENDLENWNVEQVSLLNILKKSKKKVIIINESLISLSNALSKLYGPIQQYDFEEQILSKDHTKNSLYMGLLSVWGKKYWNTLERLERISFSPFGIKGMSAMKLILKKDDLFNLWLSFLSNAYQNDHEKNELKISLEQRFNELATLTLLLESNQKLSNVELEKVNERNEILKVKNEALEREFNDFKKQHISLSPMISDKDKEISEIKKEILSERKITQTYHQKIESLTTELNICKQSLSSRFNELAVITGMLETSNREVIKLEEKLELINGKNTNIKNSLSWKITSPIRALRNPLDMKRKGKNQKINKSIQLIQGSKLFDPQWYLDTYSDVRAAGIEPTRHYLLFGGFENRDPSPNFSSQGYLDLYPDVKRSGINPLEHYIRYGEIEKRTIVAKK